MDQGGWPGWVVDLVTALMMSMEGSKPWTYSSGGAWPHAFIASAVLSATMPTNCGAVVVVGRGGGGNGGNGGDGGGNGGGGMSGTSVHAMLHIYKHSLQWYVTWVVGLG